MTTLQQPTMMTTTTPTSEEATLVSAKNLQERLALIEEFLVASGSAIETQPETSQETIQCTHCGDPTTGATVRATLSGGRLVTLCAPCNKTFRAIKHQKKTLEGAFEHFSGLRVRYLLLINKVESVTVTPVNPCYACGTRKGGQHYFERVGAGAGATGVGTMCLACAVPVAHLGMPVMEVGAATDMLRMHMMTETVEHLWSLTANDVIDETCGKFPHFVLWRFHSEHSHLAASAMASAEASLAAAIAMQ